jgi:hypothetical protein
MNHTNAQSCPPALKARARNAIAKATDYLRDRQSSNGGFCFYRWLGEPNLHDTWHAMSALTLIGAEVPRANAVAASLDVYVTTLPESLYQRAFTLDRLGLTDRLGKDDLQRLRDLNPAAVLAETVPVTARLEKLLHILCLHRRFAGMQGDDRIAEDLMRERFDGGWGDKPNLGDTWLALAILRLLDASVSLQETRDFVDALQVPSFGFTATRDSSLTNLDTVHAGVGACALLGLPVRYPDDALDYLLACQTSDGGFARTPDALPNIACTHRALQTLGTAGVIDMAPTPALSVCFEL